MKTSLESWLTTEITLADALPILLLIILTVFAAIMATRFRGTTKPVGGPVTPPPLAQAEAWLERAGLGPFWRLMFWLTVIAFFGLFLIAIAAAYVLVTNVIGSEDPSASLGLGALLVALLGAPFLIWRTVVAQRTLDTAQRQTDLQAEAHFNDKINVAATDLAARRQVTRVVGRGKEQRVLTEWQDDLVTRAAAIDRLEGLALEAMDRGDFAPAQRIARMLSIYLRELSLEYPAKPAPRFETSKQIGEWAATLRPVARPDMERAAQSLGRINPDDDAARKCFDPQNSIDLRGCNLQRFNLSGANFAGAMLRKARLDSAILNDARFEDAILLDTGMISVSASRARFHRAALGAEMSNALLGFAEFEFVEEPNQPLNGRNGRLADFRRAYLGNASFYFKNSRSDDPGWVIGAKFDESYTQGCFFNGFSVQHEQEWPQHFHNQHSKNGLAFRNCALTDRVVSRCFLEICFGDGSSSTAREHRTR